MSDGLTEKITGAAIEVHRILVPRLLLSIDEEAPCHELQLRSIHRERQKEVDVIYKGHVIKRQKLDILAEREVALELKGNCQTSGGRHRPDAFVPQIRRIEARSAHKL